MTVGEKLKRLTEGKNRAEIARRADVPAQSLTNYVVRETEPSASAALKLARALEVDLAWLVDDSADWPPPKLTEAKSIRSFTDRELMAELAHRQRLNELDLLQSVDAARRLNWRAALAELKAASGPLPDGSLAKLGVDTLLSLSVKFSRSMQEYDLSQWVVLHHSVLPGNDRPLVAFEPVRTGFIWNDVEQMPHLKEFSQIARERPEYRDSVLLIEARHYEQRDDDYRHRLTESNNDDASELKRLARQRG